MGTNKNFWLNILKTFNTPQELKTDDNLNNTFLHLNYNQDILYELNFGIKPNQNDKFLYSQLIILKKYEPLLSKLQELQNEIPHIIDKVWIHNDRWIIAKTKTVNNNNEIQDLFDKFFQNTFTIVKEFEKNIAKYYEPNQKFTLILTKEIVDKLAAEKAYFSGGLLNQAIIFNGKSCFYSSHFAGNQIYQNGAFSYSWNSHILDFRCGNYCSFAGGLKFRAETHPYERFSTSTITYNPNFPITSGGGVEKVANPHNFHPKMHIGNDVWFGAEVLLAPHLKIGTGAIAAARANVTKDIPPYAIVGGNPAKIIKYRFEDKIIEQLLETRWTEYDIMPMKMRGDIPVEQFIDLFYEYRDKGLLEPIKLKNFKEVLDRLEIPYTQV